VSNTNIIVFDSHAICHMCKHSMGYLSTEVEGTGIIFGFLKQVKKFAKSLTGIEGKEKDFFEKCIEKMKGKMDDPNAFCAGIKDELHGSTYWRGKEKSPQQVGKDVKKHKNVKVG